MSGFFGIYFDSHPQDKDGNLIDSSKIPKGLFEKYNVSLVHCDPTGCYNERVGIKFNGSLIGNPPTIIWDWNFNISQFCKEIGIAEIPESDWQLF